MGALLSGVSSTFAASQESDTGLTTDHVVAQPAEDTTAVDTEYAPSTAAPLFSADSVLGEEAKDTTLDSAFGAIQPDTAGTLAHADTSVRRTDSTALASASAASMERLRRRLYPGVSLEQHLLARQVLDFFYYPDWDSSDNSAKKLQKLEKREHLPPLSALLMVGIRVLKVLHGEYENDRAKKGLMREIDKLAAKGLELADTKNNPDSCRATVLLISGGIKGFIAALEIDRNPINAALNGLSALKLLKKAVERDTIVRDAYLGVALYHCVMSKAPAIVRGALALLGKKASLAKGISFMRICAYGGWYTNEIAQLCLTEFLSPYLGCEVLEKQKILRSLQRRYPHNPFYVFLEFEEDLCFHPENLAGFSFKDRMQQRIGRFAPSDYSSKCYANLVKWQYLIVDPFPSEELAPDKSFKLRGFSYYPVFLQATREKIAHRNDSNETRTDRIRRLRFIRAMGAKAERMLDASDDMPSNRKGLYLWHIRDALRMGQESK
jgi:hypothetical protein